MRIIFFILCTTIWAIWPAHAINQRIVQDPNSGIALFGFDPMSYHVYVEPKKGSGEFEMEYDGIAWHFYNDGNKRIFEKSPDYYMPAFGGFDPVALAQDKIAVTDPRIYMMYKGTVYLFASEANRIIFKVEAEYYKNEAELKWPKLKSTLTVR